MDKNRYCEAVEDNTNCGTNYCRIGYHISFTGTGVCRPETSFMYSNPDWIGHGLSIATIGFLMVAGGIALRLKKSN